MKNPRILMSKEDMALLKALHRMSEKDKVEYMLMGGATRHGSDYIINTLVFPNQEVSIGLVVGKGAPTWIKDIRGGFPVWIHTHLCQAFWSGTDENTICGLVPSTKDEGRLRVTLSIVIGRDRMLGRIDIHNPVEVTIDDIPVEEIADTNLEDMADKKIKGMSFGKHTPYIAPHLYRRWDMESYEEEDEWTAKRRMSGYLA